MALNFENVIDLTNYQGNPNPKIVSQLTIIHEATEGEIVQYYIDQDTHTEGDKNSNAIGVLVKPEQESAYYEYHDYDELEWSLPRSRITRQKLDRLGVKAFPDVGAIAFYKLMYRNLCKILAPVNPKWSMDRVKAPQISAVLSNGNRSVTFTITDPDDENIQFACYRICMVLDYHQLEYVTYEKEFIVDYVPVDGDYLCYCIGYINEGEICSKDSNTLELSMIGRYSSWPAVSPGNLVAHRDVQPCYIRESGTEFASDWLSLLPDGSPLIPDTITLYVVQTTGRPYVWIDNRYVPADTKYTLSAQNNKLSLEGSDNSHSDVTMVVVTLHASGWSSTAPYTQTVNADVTSFVNLKPPFVLSTGVMATDEANEIGLSCIKSGVTGNGTITFTCYTQKPEVDLTLYMERM